MADTPIVNDVPTLAAGLASAPGASREQLRALAAQFEALLLGQMLREMRQSMFDEKEDANGMGSGPLADAMFSELSVALSRAGGFGLGASLIGRLSEQAHAVDPGPSIHAVENLPTVVDSIPSPPAESWAATIPGRLSSAYGWRRDPIDGQMRFHNGLDLALPVGHDVPAARSGQVAFVGERPGYGLTVEVRHDDRTSTRYAHLSEILVEPGETVLAGATIAKSGATGRATGPHLHFEVLEEGRAVDPR